MKNKTSLTTICRVAVICAGGLAFGLQAHAANSTWTLDAAGNFSDPLNWSAGVPGTAGTGTGSSDIATFLRSNITASRLINFDANYNLGGLTFDNDNTSAVAYQIGGATFGGATAGDLTLSPSAQILVTGAGATNSTHGVDANIVLAGNASIVNDFGTSVFQFGNSSGTSANALTTAASLGNVDLILGGTSTGSNLMSMRLNEGAGTTLRLVKEGTGSWQLNGKSSGTQGLTGGLLIRQGTVSVGRSSALSIGNGTIVLGDGATASGNLTLLTGSGVTLTNNIAVASSAATNVIIERQGTGGDSIYQGTITLDRDLVLRQNSTGTARNLNIASNSILTGTGNVVIDTTRSGATGVVTLGGGSFSGAGSINMTGQLINQSTTGADGVNVTGKILSNVTAVVQNSATSTMTVSNAANAYGETLVSAGTLVVSGSGKLGTGDVSVAGGATLSLSNNATINDTSDLLFSDLAAINLNFSGTDTIGALGNTSTSTFIGIGTHDATALNAFFGGSVFGGTGSLQVSAVPEPVTVGLIAAAAAGLILLGRRRNS